MVPLQICALSGLGLVSSLVRACVVGLRISLVSHCQPASVLRCRCRHRWVHALLDTAGLDLVSLLLWAAAASCGIRLVHLG